MNDWKKELENFFEEKGIKKKIKEFTEEDEYKIKGFVEEFIKPGFNQLKDELEQYPNITVNVLTSKSKVESVYENVELNIVKTGRIVFSYKPFYIKDDGILKMGGQFYVPNTLYTNKKLYSNTHINLQLDDVSIEDIRRDFIQYFKESFGVN